MGGLCLNVYLMENLNGLKKNIMKKFYKTLLSPQKELDEAEVGYYFEVDLKYPEELHNKQRPTLCP